MPDAAKESPRGTPTQKNQAAKGPPINVVNIGDKNKATPRSKKRVVSKSPRAKSGKKLRSPRGGLRKKFRSPRTKSPSPQNKRGRSPSPRSKSRANQKNRSKPRKNFRSPKGKVKVVRHSPKRSPRGAGGKVSKSRKQLQGQKQAVNQRPTKSGTHFEYYIDGKPTNDPQVNKFLSGLFAKQYSTKTEAPNAQNQKKFGSKFEPPRIQTHKGHPQQFTQIFVPEGQNALIKQPEDLRINEMNPQAKSPYIVFNNNIENHGHLVLNQAQGQSPNAHGEGPSQEYEPDSDLSAEPAKHVYTNEETIEVHKSDDGDVSVQVLEDAHEFEKDEEGNLHPVNEDTENTFEDVKQAQTLEKLMNDAPHEVVGQWDNDNSGEAHSSFVEKDQDHLGRAGEAYHFDNELIGNYDDQGHEVANQWENDHSGEAHSSFVEKDQGHLGRAGEAVHFDNQLISDEQHGQEVANQWDNEHSGEPHSTMVEKDQAHLGRAGEECQHEQMVSAFDNRQPVDNLEAISGNEEHTGQFSYHSDDVENVVQMEEQLFQVNVQQTRTGFVQYNDGNEVFTTPINAHETIQNNQEQDDRSKELTPSVYEDFYDDMLQGDENYEAYYEEPADQQNEGGSNDIGVTQVVQVLDQQGQEIETIRTHSNQSTPFQENVSEKAQHGNVHANLSVEGNSNLSQNSSAKKYIYKDEQIIEIRSQITHDLVATSNVTQTSHITDDTTGATIAEETRSFHGGEL